MTCEVRKGSFERFLNICRHHGIEMRRIRQNPVCSFDISVPDFVRLVPLAYKTSVVPHIIKRRGFPFVLNHGRKHWSFYTGFFLFMAVLELLSSFVWQITFTGQRTFSKETLLRDVTDLDVHTGMRRKNLNCDAIEKSIREIHPEISWVSAEEVGSVLKISIKEGKNESEEDTEAQPSHLTAMYDGVVQSITVSRGVAAVKKGDTVKKGDILIQGIVPVTDDNEEVTEKIPVEAKGECVILAAEKISEEIPLKNKKKIKTGKVIKKWSIETAKHTFSIKNPLKQLDNSYKYDIITRVCCDKIFYPAGISFHLQQEKYVEYSWQEFVYSTDELKQEGYRRYNRILSQLSQNGMTLQEHNARLKQKDAGTWLLEGEVSFLCSTMERKDVTEQESKVEKAEERDDGESGNNS